MTKVETTGTIKHPTHQIADEVAQMFGRLDERELAHRERRQQLVRLAHLTRDERRSVERILEQPIDPKAVAAKTRYDEIQEQITQRITRFLKAASDLDFDYPPIDSSPIEPLDHSFWWASTRWHVTPGQSASFTDKGLHFVGGPSSHSTSLESFEFGALARFELHALRIPVSPSGHFRSTPHIELFGSLLGRTADYDLVQGDSWSKCWMFRRQRVLQLAFGPTGPVDHILGEASEFQTLIFEENAGRPVDRPMPGFQRMPEVQFAGINEGQSIWVELEVRFDIQLEGYGMLWADPFVRLRTHQWPLLAA